MARIRSIKPEFWSDPEVVACSPLARLLFVGSWNQADDFGVVKDDPERLRLQVLPADEVDADALVDELVKHNLLLRLTTPDGVKVLLIRTFCVHQKIDNRAVGRYGRPEDFLPLTLLTTESHLIPPDPASGIGCRTGLDSSPPIEVRRADVDALCDLLASLVEGNGCKRPRVTKSWRNEARRMIDLDRRDPVEAERVMRWALADEFWMGNVLSMPKFRVKYDQLKIKAGIRVDTEDAALERLRQANSA